MTTQDSTIIDYNATCSLLEYRRLLGIRPTTSGQDKPTTLVMSKEMGVPGNPQRPSKAEQPDGYIKPNLENEDSKSEKEDAESKQEDAEPKQEDAESKQEDAESKQEDIDSTDDPEMDTESQESKVGRIRERCNEDEKKLLGGLVNTSDIGAKYSDVHVHPSIIEKLEQATTLTLSRPSAFRYGVLRSHKITGALLYGPPGTGKSLLAKAMAKQSGFSMLQITSADVFQENWGNDEKAIRAAFSLARKLHPCILFVDEADAIFGIRQTKDMKHVRGMINQFLLEWDGISTNKRSAFLLLATNRPFDLDPAVLRRAPLHIHVDIPTAQGRQEIIKVCLKGEQLPPDLIPWLAKMTPSYTGSDLKNLCVSAAMVCLREEVRDPATGKYPRKRLLQRSHFNTALKSIRPTAINPAVLSQISAFERKSY